MNNSRKIFTVLLISHVSPVIPSAGNEIRILKMINWLRTEGAKVVLLLNHPLLSSKARKQLLEIVDKVYIPHDFPSFLPRKINNAVNRLFFQRPEPVRESEKVRAYLGSHHIIQATGKLCKRYKPKAVIAEYVFATPCLQKVPTGVLKLVDTHDMYSKRDPKEPYYCSTEEERAYLLNADVVIAIQPNEANHFRSLVPERRVVTVGIDYEVVAKNEVGEDYKNTVLVVGSNNPANLEGLKAFCEHAWPLVCNENPRAELLVAGKIGGALSNNVPKVRVLGWVGNLQTLYRQSALAINPTMTGTGLKIKTVEALCNGKPLVATPNAVEGLAFEGVAPFIVCDNWPKFAEAIVSLLENDNRRLALQESALRYAQANFTGRKVYAQLKAILWNQVQ